MVVCIDRQLALARPALEDALRKGDTGRDAVQPHLLHSDGLELADVILVIRIPLLLSIHADRNDESQNGYEESLHEL